MACLCPYRLGVEITSDNDVASEAEYDSMDERVQKDKLPKLESAQASRAAAMGAQETAPCDG